MTVPHSCHLLVDPPAGGAWNMAVDEALLEHVAGGDAAVWLRFYEWQEPTLSLGYFQPFAAWRDHVQGECGVVRRQTGGGAILHDRELTYSLVLPRRHLLSRAAEELYVQIHEALIAALGRLGVTAELWMDDEPSRAEEPYLCFQRRAASDVVIRTAAAAASRADDALANVSPALQRPDHKICGSAQRRRRGALLLHGSLLLRASEFAPQLLGIEGVTGIGLAPEDARAAWLEELNSVLGHRPTLLRGGLPNNIRRAAERIQQDRFLATAWTSRR